MLLRQPPKGKPKDGATFNTRSSFFSQKHQVFVSSPTLLYTQEVRKKERKKQASNLLMGAIVQLGETCWTLCSQEESEERMLLQLGHKRLVRHSEIFLQKKIWGFDPQQDL
jgi:hypothetical protein